MRSMGGRLSDRPTSKSITHILLLGTHWVSPPSTPDHALSSPATQIAQNSVFERCARAGYVVSGLLHLMIGYLAIRIALGVGGGTADQSGALAALAAKPGGIVALWVVVVALVAMALWRLVETALGRSTDPKSQGAASEVLDLPARARNHAPANGSSNPCARSSNRYAASIPARAALVPDCCRIGSRCCDTFLLTTAQSADLDPGMLCSRSAPPDSGTTAEESSATPRFSDRSTVWRRWIDRRSDLGRRAARGG